MPSRLGRSIPSVLSCAPRGNRDARPIMSLVGEWLNGRANLRAFCDVAVGPDETESAGLFAYAVTLHTAPLSPSCLRHWRTTILVPRDDADHPDLVNGALDRALADLRAHDHTPPCVCGRESAGVRADADSR